MYKSERHVIPLTDQDEIVVDPGFSKPGLLSEASVNYRAFIDGRWRAVIRYDNAHGYPHRHRFWRTPEATPLRFPMTATRLVEVAKEDLARNWLRYRRMMAAVR
jgi:hypothetical protein